MKKYRVHIFAVVRIPVEVEAESQIEAIEKAEDDTDLNSLLNRGDVEYADEITEYLVDEVEDKEYLRSTWYKDSAEGIKKQPI